MNKSLNTQTPATENQIESHKPHIKKRVNQLDGYIATSLNGGMIKPIAYKRVLAGSYDYEYKVRINIKMLTPLCPAYQALKCTLKAYWVPDSAVWKNALKWASQKGGSTTTKIKEIPNFGGKNIPLCSTYENGQITNKKIPITDTTYWRDSWTSAYMPRFQTGNMQTEQNTMYLTLPKINALTFRGFKKIWNDFERNKEYDFEFTEYDGDEISFQEYMSLMPWGTQNLNKQILRGKRQNSYYTNYRTELLGEDIPLPASGEGDLITHTSWQKEVAEMRSQAENAQLNDRQVIAKLYGTRELKDGYIQKLGQKTFSLNYGVVNQTAYNDTQGVAEEYKSLGVQGAYSYTEVEIPLYQFQEFKEHGFIHVIAQVSADSVYETAFDRFAHLNVDALDYYRPDMKDLKHDVIYRLEKIGTNRSAENIGQIDGFKRKFSEIFKLPNIVSGDMTTRGYYESKQNLNSSEAYLDTKIESQHAYQFFEENDEYAISGAKKHIWKDYTDTLINENLAVREEEEEYSNTEEAGYLMRIKGQNQIFLLGMHYSNTDLPVDEEIKNNFTGWGEE